jgi:hypothetical protein
MPHRFVLFSLSRIIGAEKADDLTSAVVENYPESGGTSVETHNFREQA